MTPQVHHDEGATFPGTDRFAVLDRLGVGSTCAVFRVRDQEHGDVVALKTLRHLDAASLYRLKQEFRALSQLDHPNLVSFYELVHEEKAWFVTMELVEGVDFLTDCRGEAPETPDERPPDDLSFARSAPVGTGARTEGRAGDPPAEEREGGALPDLLRLRSSLRQLVDGVHTLHEAGRIHRDLKPSNVLVTDAGRVVILDFGLVAEIDQDYTEGTLHQNIAGSAAYMSPEQSVGQALTRASDWYSVGVMLYEALTGVWPHSGHLYEILTNKQRIDPIRPSERVQGIPEDLDALCMALLSRDPTARPTGPEVAERLRTQRPAVNSAFLARPTSGRFRFREGPLQALDKALQAARWGRPVVCLVRGPRGVGKTTLLREFIKQSNKSERLTTLKGRCHIWEQVPFEALDGVIDNLTRVLRRQDLSMVRALEGPAMDRLATCFPVLGRVRELELQPMDRGEAGVIEGAVEGLRQAIAMLGRQGPVVIAVDDVQWGDAESGALLGQLLAGEALPLMVLASYTPAEPGPMVETLIRSLQSTDVQLVVVDVEPLGLNQSAALAAELLGREVHDPQVQAIAAESGGMPAAVRELVRRADRGQRAVLQVNEVIVARLEGLPEAPRRLLGLLALAGGAVSTAVAIGAAGLGAEAFRAITTLRALELVLVDGEDGPDGTLELPGAPLGEHVLERLSEEERGAGHLALALALEGMGGARPEALVEHYAAAGEGARAAMVAWMASDEAGREGRWEAVVWLLKRALQYGEWSTRERQALKGQLGRALSAVGRGREAARTFLQAAEEAPRLRVGPLRLRAAQQLLVSGHLDEGLPILEGILGDVGLRGLPRGICVRPLTVLRRMRLRWRGPKTVTRSVAEVDADRLLRVDAVATAAESLMLVDPALGRCLQAQHLLEALDLGEPARLGRALAGEIVVQGMAEPTRPTWRETWSSARPAVGKKGDPVARARTTAAAAVAAYSAGLWGEANLLCTEALGVFEKDPEGSGWQRFRTRWVRGRARLYLGELREVAAGAIRLHAEVEQAEDRLFGTLLAGSLLPVVRMAEDDPDAGVRDVEASLGAWSRSGFHLQHGWCLLARVRLDLYRGRASYAWERLSEGWSALVRSGAWHDPVLRTEAWLARGAVAVAVTAGGKDLSRASRAAVRQVEREGFAWAAPWAQLIEAGRRRVQGEQAWELLSEAQRGFESGGMALGAALARRGLVERDGGDPDAWLREQGVRAPDRFARAMGAGE